MRMPTAYESFTPRMPASSPATRTCVPGRLPFRTHLLAGGSRLRDRLGRSASHRCSRRYSFSSPPGGSANQLVLSTYYSHHEADLVATLSGCGRLRRAPPTRARSLPRDPSPCDPPQISRQVFSTPRVHNSWTAANSISVTSTSPHSIRSSSAGHTARLSAA